MLQSFTKSLVVIIASSLAACGAEGSLDVDDFGEDGLDEPFFTAGNGAPNGQHFNLNLIGMDQVKSEAIAGGNRIFTMMSGGTKIMLSEGAYAVLDGNGTDGKAAFQLPSPDPENDGVTTYSVWARALGRPGGSASMNTCATDVSTGDEYCSVYRAVLLRTKGKQSFSDVSRELLYVYADLDADGTLERVPLFDSALSDFYWQFDNQGLRLAQLRFYEEPAVVP